MKKIALVAAALAALVGCTTEEESGNSTTETSAVASTESGGSDTTTAPSSDPRAPGVTADAVKIGIMYTDFTRVGPLLGYDQGDIEAAYNVLFDEINANGGVNGRTIVPVFAPVDPSSTDGPTVACTKLAQDEDVFLVMGFIFGEADLCLLSENEKITLGGTQTAEKLAQAKVGWWTLDPGSEILLNGISTIADLGRFSDKLAVVGTSDTKAFYENEVLPVLQAAGAEPISVAYMDPTFDANQTYSDAQTIAERFKADGADQILMLSLGNIFPQGLVRTDFRPQLIFDSLQNALVYTSDASNDVSLLQGAIAAGLYDSGELFESLGSPTKECLDKQREAGLELLRVSEVPEGGSKQIVSSLIACRYVTLLVAALEKAGPNLDYGTFTDAMNNLGEIMLPGDPDPLTFGPPPAADGDPTQYIYAWDDSAKLFVIDEG